MLLWLISFQPGAFPSFSVVVQLNLRASEEKYAVLSLGKDTIKLIRLTEFGHVLAC